jgi:hypothetical protein
MATGSIKLVSRRAWQARTVSRGFSLALTASLITAGLATDQSADN